MVVNIGQRGTLTKKFLMSLPSGVFIVSNVGHSPVDPVFAEYVLSPAVERERQWEKIMSRGCNGRLCTVFTSEQEAIEFINSWPTKTEPKAEPSKTRKARLHLVK
jgi:hypothetical protein